MIIDFIARVSHQLQVINDVTESETTIAKAEIIADRIVETFQNNQVQLCHERAHSRKPDFKTFIDLRGD